VIDDARTIPSGCQLEADICVVGAGAAGITLALGLRNSRLRTIVLESGGLSYELDSQKLYSGNNLGLRYEPLDLCRVRTFGGSTDRRGWGGWCKPLAPIDFEVRPWVPLSGWPIDRKELDPYYRRAFGTLLLPPDTDERAAVRAKADINLPVTGGNICNEPCALSPYPHLADTWGDPIRVSSNVRVLLHANVTEIVADRTGRTCESLNVATLTGNAFSVKATYVVLAAGGIENARLLLVSDRVERDGIGNRSGFVGRCFMEHPRFAWGEISYGQHPEAYNWLRGYDPGFTVGRRRGDAIALGAPPLFGSSLAVTEEAQRREEILGARTWLLPVCESGDLPAARDLKELVMWIRKGRIPSDARLRVREAMRDIPNCVASVMAHYRAKLRPAHKWQFITVLEQEPDPDSRVMLDQKRDRLGMRHANLNWKLGPLTNKTLNRTRELMAEAVRSCGLKCKVEGKGNQTVQDPRWVWHHMGTTRISEDPRAGVVDKNLRVHGMSNLFIAGSSVFPTGGNDMPTTTVIAMAHRLGDHLKSLLDAPIEDTKSEPERQSTPSSPA